MLKDQEQEWMKEAVAAMKPWEQEDLASASTLASTFITKSFSLAGFIPVRKGKELILRI